MAMGEGQKLFWVAVILFGFGFATGIIPNPLSTADVGVSGGARETTINVKTDPACGSTTMTMDYEEKYNAGTSMTSHNGTVYINGAKKGIFSEGGTFTVQGGDVLDVYYALDPASTTFASAHAHGQIPCTGQTAAFLTSGTYKEKPILAKGALALSGLQDPPHKVYRTSNAASQEAYNKENNDVLTTTALSITAGATKTAKVIITWDYEDGYGVADGNTLSCRFVDSEFDQSEIVASIDGKALGPAKYTPSSTRFGLSSSNQTTKHWAFPAIDGKATTSTTLEVRIKGDDTNQPTTGTNFSCQLFDTDLFELDVGGVGIGVEDSDDNSNVGRSTDLTIEIDVS